MQYFLDVEFQFLILCLSTLLTLINPLGIAPIFIVMTERFSKKEKVKIAKKGIATGTITLLVFTLLGSIIFNLYGITLEAFQIMGGILFFRSGLRMLEAQVGRSRSTDTEIEEFKESDEIAISPIGIPLIAGPGAITGVMLLSGKAPSTISLGTLLLAVLITMIIFYFILRAGDQVGKKIGVTGMRVIQRIMGLILMVIAVQFVINGVETIITRL
ncbi:MAG: NAAT family transporter [Candidatus Marinimicrobia bacterium]|jgi:multiple antibiotic resistance protein|nr:NAAT family transporter [Candidatus Neomarinimicrobiota bacterium]MDC0865548.1 NAAT family transporter [bacterium]MBT3797164.1 NAAT family transporter [Candidatus Neomarinimicrobiota bacterium]MBT4148817.1 NAAT family transporter [Candidatus Neomarinimicrobiota bacterium]MBT4318521.1 NAAT family transporter [Candidatus Neomarinimicrobiota bacterium]|tara:strand:- start:244 stop:888 length:645 start_codon:yes stop_codon:yes gene_type:complete